MGVLIVKPSENIKNVYFLLELYFCLICQKHNKCTDFYVKERLIL